MLQGVRYKEYCIFVRNAHKKALDRIELARLPLEERMATQLEQLAMQQAEAHSHAVKAMLANLKVTQNPMTSAAVVVDEPDSRDQQASFASLTVPPVLQQFVACCTLLTSIQCIGLFMSGQRLSPRWRLREVGGH